MGWMDGKVIHTVTTIIELNIMNELANTNYLSPYLHFHTTDGNMRMESRLTV